MRTRFRLIRVSSLLLAGGSVLFGAQAPATPDSVRWRDSWEDLCLRLAEQRPLKWQREAAARDAVIELTPAETFQTMLGLGSSLEPATCANLSRMPAADRERTIVRLVGPPNGIGIPIHAVTVQNEPGAGPSFDSGPTWHYPSCRWDAGLLYPRAVVRDPGTAAFARRRA
jgi:hypothetical protein